MEAAVLASDADLAELIRLSALARTAIASERGGRLHLVREAWPEPVSVSLRMALHDPDQLVLVGNYAGQALGYLAAHAEVLRDGGELAVISDLFVEPAAREVGIGEALITAALAWAQARRCVGIDAVALPGNRQLKNLFERHGLVARAIVVHRSLSGTDD